MVAKHYPELNELLLNPIAICLQGTCFKPYEILNLRTYHSIRKDVTQSRGVAIFIKNNIPKKEIQIQSELQGSTLSFTLLALSTNNLTLNIDPALSKCLYVDNLLL